MKEKIRKFYAKVAEGEEDDFQYYNANDKKIGKENINSPPLLSLGCDYPLDVLELKGDEKILELGAGGGINCFLASQKVSKGLVVGLDFSEEMVKKALKDLEKTNIHNLKFVVSDVEKIPFRKESFDIIFTNCVLNLINKSKVLNEINKTLKPDGRALLSEIISNKPVPEEKKDELRMWVSCLAGAMTEENLLGEIQKNNLERVNSFKKVKLLELKEEELTFYKTIFEIGKIPT